MLSTNTLAMALVEAARVWARSAVALPAIASRLRSFRWSGRRKLIVQWRGGWFGLESASGPANPLTRCGGLPPSCLGEVHRP